MKKFLQSVHAAQGTVITAFKQKKEATRLSQIGGTQVFDGGDINFSQYKKMIENVDRHSYDWKQYNADSNKIVIEKNFFLNYIKETKALFMFRPFNDDGLTEMKTPEDFSEKVWKSYDSGIAAAVYLLSILLIWYMVTLFGNYGYLSCILILVIILFHMRIHKKDNLRIKVSQEEYEEDPSLILNVSPCSFPERNSYRKFKFIINKNGNNELRSFYDNTLQSMVVTAARLGGRISWLMYYRKDISNALEWSLRFYSRDKEDSSKNEVHVTINTGYSSFKDLVLIPVIETEYSFIFQFENLTDDMDITDKTVLKNYIENSPVVLDERLLVPIERY